MRPQRRTAASRAASSCAPCSARWASQTSRVRRSASPRPRRAAPADLQQRAPLLEHPLVVGPHPGHPRDCADDQVVEEAAPLARVAAHDRQVLGREQHRAQHAEHIAGPRRRRAVEPRPVGPARRDLELDPQLAAPLRHHGRPDDGALGAGRTSGASVGTR